VTNGDELAQVGEKLPLASERIQCEIDGRHVGTRTPDLYRVNSPDDDGDSEKE
jgi:hypothetical protein